MTWEEKVEMAKLGGYYYYELTELKIMNHEDNSQI